MSQLRMFLDMEKHPLPDYPVPEGFRITRNGPEVAERYEVLREGAGWGKLKPDFLTNKVIPKGLVFCEEIATGLPVASATAEFSDYPGHRGDWGRAIAATGAISGRFSVLKHIAEGSSALCHASPPCASSLKQASRKPRS